MAVYARRWNKQPSGPARVDWSNPLTRGLVLAVLPHSPVNMVTGQGPINVPAGITPSAGRSGVGGQFPGTSSGYLAYPLPVGSGPMSGLAIARFGSNAAQVVLGSFNLAGGQLGHYIAEEASNSLSAISTSGANWTVAGGAAPVLETDTVLAAQFIDGGGRTIWVNGALSGADAIARTVTGQDVIIVGAYYGGGTAQVPMAGTLYLALWWTRALSDAEIASVSRDPWQLFKAPARIWTPHGAAGTTHSSTGALTGGGATTSGAAARSRAHPSTGALAGGGAAVVGAAAHSRAHASSGALAGGGAAIAGTSRRTRAHPATGVLGGAGGALAGTAARTRAHPSTGALAGAGGAASGAAARTRVHPSTGALTAGGATVSGAAARSSPGAHNGTGALAGGGAAVVGSASRTPGHPSTGALAGGGAAVAGIAARSRAHASTGALVGAGAAVAGVAARNSTHAATGALVGAGAIMAGVAARFGGGTADPGAVWNYVMANGETAETNLLALLACCTRLTKVLTNKQTTDPTTGQMTVYDDDGVSVLLQGDLFEDIAGAIRYRGQGADRRERLT